MCGIFISSIGNKEVKSRKRKYYIASDNGYWKQGLLKVELLKIPDFISEKTYLSYSFKRKN